MSRFKVIDSVESNHTQVWLYIEMENIFSKKKLGILFIKHKIVFNAFPTARQLAGLSTCMEVWEAPGRHLYSGSPSGRCRLAALRYSVVSPTTELMWLVSYLVRGGQE